MQKNIMLLVCIWIVQTNLYGQYSYQDHLRQVSIDSIAPYSKIFAPAWSIAFSLDQNIPIVNDGLFGTHNWNQSSKSWDPIPLDEILQTGDRYGHLRAGLQTSLYLEGTFDPFKNRALRLHGGVILRHYEVRYGGHGTNIVESQYFVEGVARVGIQLSPFTWIANTFRKKENRWKTGFLGQHQQSRFFSWLSNDLFSYSFFVDKVFGGRYGDVWQMRHQIENLPATVYFSRKKSGLSIRLSILFTHVSEKTLEGGWIHYMEYTVRLRTSITQECRKNSIATTF